MEESDLIKLAQKGDKSAFEQLLSTYYDVMFRMAMRYCGNRQDAEDITQNACIKLARNIDSYRFKSAFTTWLYRMVINCAIDFARTQKKTVTFEEDMAGSVKPQAETNLYANEILQKVYALPDKEKTALLLVLSDGMTHKEASKVMECKESTVSWYIHEARKKLGVKNGKELRHG